MNSPQITVYVDRCVMQILVEGFFSENSLTNIRKLFRLISKEPGNNLKAITTLDGYIPVRIAEAKEKWHRASISYTDGYVETKFKYNLTRREKQAIERANKKLLDAVKRAKTEYEKCQKILIAYEDFKKKINYKGD